MLIVVNDELRSDRTILKWVSSEGQDAPRITSQMVRNTSNVEMSLEDELAVI